MTEIEIKAHVKNREKLIVKLNEFASYLQTVTRDDNYYHLQMEKPVNGSDYISARIRKETKQDENGGCSKTYLTYKRKELRTDSTGAVIEVNDEKETEISDSSALLALLTDCGFVPKLHKFKKVIDYIVETEFGTATLEVCNVEFLGDFIEIEILSEDSSAGKISKIQNKLKELLEQCGIPQSDIEPRYYSELLKAAGKIQ